MATRNKRARTTAARAATTAISTSKLADQRVVKSQVTDTRLVQKRREQIVAAAIELFSNQGYYRTSIQDIARKAGVSIGLIYQYAQTKEDVLLLTLLNVLETYREEIPQAVKTDAPPLEALWTTLDTYCRIIDRRRSATVLAYRSTKSLPKAQREHIKQLEIETNEYVAQRLRDCIAAGLFRPVNVDVTSYQVVLYAHMWALKHWRLRDMITIDAYIAEGFDFFVRAMATPKGLTAYARLRDSQLAAKR